MTMNRKILLLLGFLFLSSALFSQPGVVINYANGMHNRASNAVNTHDGGFLILMNSNILKLLLTIKENKKD